MITVDSKVTVDSISVSDSFRVSGLYMVTRDSWSPGTHIWSLCEDDIQADTSVTSIRPIGSSRLNSLLPIHGQTYSARIR